MEVVKDFEFKERGARGKYRELYKEFLALPHGTAVKFTKGQDFESESAKFAVSLRTGLWNKGFKARVAVRGDDVYAQIVGKRDVDPPPPGKRAAQKAIRLAAEAGDNEGGPELPTAPVELATGRERAKAKAAV